MVSKPVMREISTADVIVPEVRITSFFDSEILASFKQSLKEVGALEPIIVVPQGEKYLLVDGFHRLQEYRNQGLEKIRAVVLPAEEKDVYVLNIVTNTLRGKFLPTDLAKVLGHLYNDLKVPIEEIVAKTGLNRDTVEFYIKLNQCDPEIIDALDAGEIKIGHARELMRLPTREGRLKLLTQIRHFRIPVKDTKDIVDEALKLQQEKPAVPAAVEEQPPAPETGVCHVCGKEYKLSYLKGIVVCPECFYHLIEKMKQEQGRSEGGT